MAYPKRAVLRRRMIAHALDRCARSKGLGVNRQRLVCNKSKNWESSEASQFYRKVRKDFFMKKWAFPHPARQAQSAR